MLCAKFSNFLQIHHQYEWNLFTIKTHIKKYQNESESYCDKYVFKVNRSRSKQHNTKCSLKKKIWKLWTGIESTRITKTLNPSRLISVQRYLKKLNKRGKLANDKYDKIRPKSAKLARAHGLPKIHKLFKNIPSFCPIIDTTGTTHYSVGK